MRLKDVPTKRFGFFFQSRPTTTNGEKSDMTTRCQVEGEGEGGNGRRRKKSFLISRPEAEDRREGTSLLLHQFFFATHSPVTTPLTSFHSTSLPWRM